MKNVFLNTYSTAFSQQRADFFVPFLQKTRFFALFFKMAELRHPVFRSLAEFPYIQKYLAVLK